jgi:uncharacterized protein (DUF58 family)
MTAWYPSRRAVLIVALGIPISLLAALAAPAFWMVGLYWSLGLIVLALVDLALASGTQRLQIVPRIPAQAGVGRALRADFSISFRSRAPATAEIELEGNGRFDIAPRRLDVALAGPASDVSFDVTALRRGPGRLERLWLRWTGPLGLAWVQSAYPLARDVPVLTDVETVREQAMRLFQRGADYGLHERLNRGSGTEFHALRNFQPGHDRRQIDWKQSARHNALIVKEFRVEQNQHIVCVLDTGRMMSEPLMGQARLDRALHATLLLAYVGLKLGDRVGLFAFDSRPRLRTGTVSGVAAFAALQRQAASLDYSDAETNFTLGLTQLLGDLEHRSLVVIFTDFADTMGAELMLENVGRLVQRHTVLFVVFHDEELESIQNAEPENAQDASRAVIADRLLRERDIVLGRLRQLGVHVVDVPLQRMNMGVIDAYLAIKQRLRFQP